MEVRLRPSQGVEPDCGLGSWGGEYGGCFFYLLICREGSCPRGMAGGGDQNAVRAEVRKGLVTVAMAALWVLC